MVDRDVKGIGSGVKSINVIWTQHQKLQEGQEHKATLAVVQKNTNQAVNTAQQDSTCHGHDQEGHCQSKCRSSDSSANPVVDKEGHRKNNIHDDVLRKACMKKCGDQS